jgi:hypothetical protein
MDNNIIEFLPREEREELADMRAYWLAVSDDRDVMGRVAKLAERVADILNETEIADADRQSLLWHLSLIRELAVKREPGIKPLCKLPRFNPPDGAA